MNNVEQSAKEIITKVNEVMLNKGTYVRPPTVMPDRIDYVHATNFLYNKNAL